MEIKTNNPAITVIVPCWKAGKYIDRLLENLQNQTFKNFAVLLVNDGDRTQQIDLDRIAAQDDRISVVWKENGGASSARNVGIDQTNTEWIVFADADDSFSPDYLSNLYNSVAGTEAEMGIGGYTQIYVLSGKSSNNFINVTGGSNVMSLNEAYELILPARINAYPWNKIYKTSLIKDNKVYMDPKIGVIHDYVFNMELFKKLKYVSLIPDSGYIYYMEDSGSLVSSYDKNFEHDRRLVIKMEDELNELMGWSDKRREEAKKKELAKISFMIMSNLYKRRSPLSFREKKKRIKEEVFEKNDIIDAVREIPANGLIGKINKFLLLRTNPMVATMSMSVLSFLKNHFFTIYRKVM